MAGVTGVTHSCVSHRRDAASYHLFNFMSMRLFGNLAPGLSPQSFNPSRRPLRLFWRSQLPAATAKKGGGPKAASQG